MKRPKYRSPKIKELLVLISGVLIQQLRLVLINTMKAKIFMIGGKIPRGCFVKSYCRNLCFEDWEMDKGWESHGARVFCVEYIFAVLFE